MIFNRTRVYVITYFLLASVEMHHTELTVSVISTYNSTAVKKLTINFHEWALILLISRVRSTSGINKINAHEWKLSVNFE